MKSVLIIIHGVNNLYEINNTKKLLEYKLKEEKCDLKVKIALSSEKIIKKLHSSGNIDIKGIDKSIDELVDEGIESLYCSMVYVNSGESYLEAMDRVNNYKDNFKNISFTTPLLYEKDIDHFKDVISATRNFMKKGNKLLIFHGGKPSINNEIDNFINNLSESYEEKVISSCVDKKDFFDSIKKLIGKSETTYIYPFIINRGYHYRKNIVAAVQKLKEDGYNVLLKEKTLIENNEICEIFIKKLLKIIF